MSIIHPVPIIKIVSTILMALSRHKLTQVPVFHEIWLHLGVNTNTIGMDSGWSRLPSWRRS